MFGNRTPDDNQTDSKTTIKSKLEVEVDNGDGAEANLSQAPPLNVLGDQIDINTDPGQPATVTTDTKPAGGGNNLKKRSGRSSQNTDNSTGLINLRQQALDNLSPLVDELDQPPLEHFRTLMMLIQATNNPALIQKALETANTISDDRQRAQALLDIVNEINYLTQNQKN